MAVTPRGLDVLRAIIRIQQRTGWMPAVREIGADLGAPTLVTRLTHVSGEALEYQAPLFLQGQDMQKYGAALTYARRYAWAAALGIANDEDDDGNHASAPVQSAKPAENGSRVISEAQRKRLYAMSKEANLSDDELKTLVAEVAGVQSSKDIPVGVYDRLCEAVQGAGILFMPSIDGLGN